MKEYLSDMRLDPEVISREHLFTRGLGAAHFRAAKEMKDPVQHSDHLAFSATNFRRAAADALLLNDFKVARGLFARAGEIYAALRMPYALFMFELADESERARAFWSNIIEREWASSRELHTHTNKQHVYTLLFYSAERGKRDDLSPLEDVPETIWTNLESARPSPIGVLGVPVGAYLDLSRALTVEDGKISTEEALLPFLTAYNTAILQATASAHHWRQMSLPFHPAEPDLLGVLVLSHLGLQHRQRSIINLLAGMPLSWQASTVIKEFLRMRFREEESERHR